MQHEDELVLHAAGGCARSFETIYRLHAPRIALILQPFARDHQELEDLIHDAFCRVISGLKTYQPRGRFRSWVAAIALNTGRKALRDRRRRSEITNWDIDSFSDPNQSTPDHGERAYIATLVSRLPMERRLVVILRYWLDFTYDEISELLEIPAGTARRRNHTAIRELRTAIGDTHIDGREYFHAHRI